MADTRSSRPSRRATSLRAGMEDRSVRLFGESVRSGSVWWGGVVWRRANRVGTMRPRTTDSAPEIAGCCLGNSRRVGCGPDAWTSTLSLFLQPVYPGTTARAEDLATLNVDFSDQIDDSLVSVFHAGGVARRSPVRSSGGAARSSRPLRSFVMGGCVAASGLSQLGGSAGIARVVGSTPPPSRSRGWSKSIPVAAPLAKRAAGGYEDPNRSAVNRGRAFLFPLRTSTLRSRSDSAILSEWAGLAPGWVRRPRIGPLGSRASNEIDPEHGPT